MTKRILAILLTLAMVLSLFSVNVFAADAANEPKTVRFSLDATPEGASLSEGVEISDSVWGTPALMDYRNRGPFDAPSKFPGAVIRITLSEGTANSLLMQPGSNFGTMFVYPISDPETVNGKIVYTVDAGDFYEKFEAFDDGKEGPNESGNVKVAGNGKVVGLEVLADYPVPENAVDSGSFKVSADDSNKWWSTADTGVIKSSAYAAGNTVIFYCYNFNFKINGQDSTNGIYTLDLTDSHNFSQDLGFVFQPGRPVEEATVYYVIVPTASDEPEEPEEPVEPEAPSAGAIVLFDDANGKGPDDDEVLDTCRNPWGSFGIVGNTDNRGDICDITIEEVVELFKTEGATLSFIFSGDPTGWWSGSISGPLARVNTLWGEGDPMVPFKYESIGGGKYKATVKLADILSGYDMTADDVKQLCVQVYIGNFKLYHVEFTVPGAPEPAGYVPHKALEVEAKEVNGDLVITPNGNVKTDAILVTFDGAAPEAGEVSVVIGDGSSYPLDEVVADPSASFISSDSYIIPAASIGEGSTVRVTVKGKVLNTAKMTQARFFFASGSNGGFGNNVHSPVVMELNADGTFEYTGDVTVNGEATQFYVKTQAGGPAIDSTSWVVVESLTTQVVDGPALGATFTAKYEKGANYVEVTGITKANISSIVIKSSKLPTVKSVKVHEEAKKKNFAFAIRLSDTHHGYLINGRMFPMPHDFADGKCIGCGMEDTSSVDVEEVETSEEDTVDVAVEE